MRELGEQHRQQKAARGRPGDMIMLFKGNSSRLEHLIEKIQANKENHEVTSEDIKGQHIFFIGT